MNPSQSRLFEQQLAQLINNCNLPVTEAYYIVTNAALQLQLLYDKLLYDKTANTDIVEEIAMPTLEEANVAEIE